MEASIYHQVLPASASLNWTGTHTTTQGVIKLQDKVSIVEYIKRLGWFYRTLAIFRFHQNAADEIRHSPEANITMGWVVYKKKETNNDIFIPSDLEFFICSSYLYGIGWFYELQSSCDLDILCWGHLCICDSANFKNIFHIFG